MECSWGKDSFFLEIIKIFEFFFVGLVNQSFRDRNSEEGARNHVSCPLTLVTTYETFVALALY